MIPNGPDIAAGTFHASFLFDVADTIDLKKLRSIAGSSAEPAPLRFPTAPSPEHIQFAVPPLAATLPSATIGANTATTRAKIYDYGVISIRFSFPYMGPWSDFIDLAVSLRKGDGLLNEARRLLQDVRRDSSAALIEPHDMLVEDYFVCAVERLVAPIDAATLLRQFAPAVAGLTLAEPSALSPEEQAETLRLHFSYFPDDLAVVQWDSAFIYDTRDNADVILDLLEFANSQLVE